MQANLKDFSVLERVFSCRRANIIRLFSELETKDQRSVNYMIYFGCKYQTY
jgi:hypothetical protein